ncbi:MAG: hypothetical protein ACREMN_01210 [Gemmatimonadales bacterium]
MRKVIIGALTAGLLAAACSPDDAPTGAQANELLLAQQAEAIATDIATTTATRHEDWLRRLFEALRGSEDPEAQSCLAEARALRQDARAAYEAGHREEARELLRQAFLKVLCAVVEVFPDAAERTGAAVDQIVSRIEERLGDRDAPRIRAILAHVQEIRSLAVAALAEGDEVRALALNLRAIQILHRLVSHVRDGHDDHDAVADSEMHDLGI